MADRFSLNRWYSYIEAVIVHFQRFAHELVPCLLGRVHSRLFECKSGNDLVFRSIPDTLADSILYDLVSQSDLDEPPGYEL